MAEPSPPAAIEAAAKGADAPARRGQDKATFVIWDLEYTTWEGARERGWSGPGEHREIVQIGAVRVDAAFDELAALDIIVRPRINPVLSDYFVALTGITQARVEAEGVDLEEAIRRLVAFAAPGLNLVSNGDDPGILDHNCALYRLANPLAGRCHNVEGRILAELGHRPLSCELPRLFGLPAARDHDGLADARAVAGTLKELQRRGRLDDWP